jgi:hypothetical protein
MGLVVLIATLCFLLLEMERCDLIVMNKWTFIHKVLIICILPAWAWAAPVNTVREQQFINQQQRQQRAGKPARAAVTGYSFIRK